MPEKTKEIPLHDVVLKIMFEENKERPAQLAVSEVFWKISDAAITEHNILEVLNWLVGHKRVEKASGKYSLDRYEFLDQRKIDRGDNAPEKVKSSKKKDSDSKEEESPLHDVILKLMFEASKEKPAELTVNDVYWMTSEPSILEGQVSDVLKWLLHHRRVEYRDGKYSLDRFEFLDQTKADEAVKVVKPKEKKINKEPEAAKSPTKVKPKIIIPSTPDEPIVAKKPIKPKPREAKKKTAPPKVQETVKVPDTPKIPEPKKKAPVVKAPETKVVDIPKIPEPVKVQEPINDSGKLKAALLVVAAVFFVYSCYLLISMSASVTPESSSKLQEEIISAEFKLKQLSESQKSASLKLEEIEQRLILVEEITTKRSQQLDVQNQNSSDYKSVKSIIMRLLISNSLILLVFGFLLFKGDRKRVSKKD
jgi:hypothetical protein